MDTKKKVQKMRQHRNRTGGGSPSDVKLTEFDERIIAIVGDFCTDGDSALTEIGFDDSIDGKFNQNHFSKSLTESTNNYRVCMFQR